MDAKGFSSPPCLFCACPERLPLQGGCRRRPPASLYGSAANRLYTVYPQECRFAGVFFYTGCPIDNRVVVWYTLVSENAVTGETL